jgi:hypothetical protein
MLSASMCDTRTEATRVTDHDEVALWRWFCMMYDEDRIRWCRCHQNWLVSIDHTHLATESNFDTAIKTARNRFYSGRRAASADSDKAYMKNQTA